MKVRSILFTVISAIALILPFLLLPIAYALVFAVAILVVLILIDANGNRILFRMSIRNIIRRPGTTALVVGGLMVGTAIISASFVVGDTMNNMITDQVTKGMGQVDFELQSDNVGTVQFYNSSQIAPLATNISSTQHVRAVDTLILTSVSVRDSRTLLFSPSVTLMGVDDKLLSDFGGLVGQDGSPITSAPAAGTVIINQKAAVECGHWPLYRYNPMLAKEGKNPLKLDSKAPKIRFEEYAYTEARYKMLTKSNPEEAKRLMALAEEDTKRRYRVFEELAREAPALPPAGGAAH